jgi:hypothetical protein
MTGYYMVRSFDHAGYYETRLIMMLVAFGVACYALRRKRDPRYFVMLISGVFFQGLMEYILQATGLRGAGYHFSVFGISMSGVWANLFQGLAEGAIFSLMAFWFVDLKTGENPAISWKGFVAAYALIVALSAVVGVLAAGQPITSPRPMFGTATVWWLAGTAGPALLLGAWKHGLRYVGYFFIGLFIYSFVTFEPLQILGARYIGVRTSTGGLEPAPFLAQAGIMLYSHIVEVSAQKMHYFAVPFALGLLPPASLSPAERLHLLLANGKMRVLDVPPSARKP